MLLSFFGATCAEDACGGDGAVIVDLLQLLTKIHLQYIACIPMHTDHVLHSACLWSLFRASAKWRVLHGIGRDSIPT